MPAKVSNQNSLPNCSLDLEQEVEISLSPFFKPGSFEQILSQIYLLQEKNCLKRKKLYFVISQTEREFIDKNVYSKVNHYQNENPSYLGTCGVVCIIAAAVLPVGFSQVSEGIGRAADKTYDAWNKSVESQVVLLNHFEKQAEARDNKEKENTQEANQTHRSLLDKQEQLMQQIRSMSQAIMR